MQKFKFKKPEQSGSGGSGATDLKFDTSAAEELLRELKSPVMAMNPRKRICECGDPTCNIGPFTKLA